MRTSSLTILSLILISNLSLASESGAKVDVKSDRTVSSVSTEQSYEQRRAEIKKKKYLTRRIGNLEDR